MRSLQRNLLLMAFVSLCLKRYAFAATGVDLLTKLQRLQQRTDYDDRFNEIPRDPMDNVLFFLSDDSREAYYTTTPTTTLATTTKTTTTEANEASSEVGSSSDEDYRRMSDLVYRQSRARLALTSTMMGLMRNLMTSIFG